MASYDLDLDTVTLRTERFAHSSAKIVLFSIRIYSSKIPKLKKMPAFLKNICPKLIAYTVKNYYRPHKYGSFGFCVLYYLFDLSLAYLIGALLRASCMSVCKVFIKVDKRSNLGIHLMTGWIANQMKVRVI